ncbi:MAG TPA: hypothetical protein VFG68_21215, partial [Fimbriiglobus sp.]|nr:hypothetical protein [Fimbriiglobus sp.]
MAPLCTFTACSVLVAELLYLLTCRPDLHPRLSRRTLVTPVDVRKVLLVRRTAFGVAAGVFRTFAR